MLMKLLVLYRFVCMAGLPILVMAIAAGELVWKKR